MSEAPYFDPSDVIYELTLDVLPDSDAWTFIESLFVQDYEDQDPGQLTKSQLFWLANQNPHVMEGHARAIYAALEKLGLLGFVPMDNVALAKQEEL